MSEPILMKITGYTDEEFEDQFAGDPYEVIMNPDTIKWNRAIDYNETQAPDSSSASQKYKSSPSDKLSFDIVIDCTGIVNADRTDMAKEISALEKIVFTYNGDIHRPNFVKIQWGQQVVFKGVLVSLDTSYTLFRPDGSPLRAKLSLAFSQYISPSTAEKKNARKSQDLTHRVVVEEGLALPQLCYKVWKNELQYVRVARFNGLNKFRNMHGVGMLLFPPIKQP